MHYKLILKMLINFQGVHQFGLFLVTRTLFCGKDMLGGQSGGNKEQFTTKYKMGSRAQKKSFFINTISTNTNIWKTIISKEIIRNAKS